MDQPYCDEGEPGLPTPPRPHGPMGGGGRDDRRKSKRYRRWRPGPDDHAHTELLANLHRIINPSVIVQPFEFDIGRPDRFAWHLCGVCRSTPVSVRLTWRAQIVVSCSLLFLVRVVFARSESPLKCGSHCSSHSWKGCCQMVRIQLALQVISSV